MTDVVPRGTRVAGFGRRFAALLVDLLMSYLVAVLITRSRATGLVSSAVLFVEYVIFLSIDGRTAGMRVAGLRVVRLDGRPPGPWNALIRSLLLMLVIPAVIWDRDRRGLHDKATGTLVVRA